MHRHRPTAIVEYAAITLVQVASSRHKPGYCNGDTNRHVVDSLYLSQHSLCQMFHVSRNLPATIVTYLCIVDALQLSNRVSATRTQSTDTL